jgi:hypothetical protein
LENLKIRNENKKKAEAKKIVMLSIEENLG